jgi:hypothetical protein
MMAFDDRMTAFSSRPAFFGLRLQLSDFIIKPLQPVFKILLEVRRNIHG